MAILEACTWHEVISALVSTTLRRESVLGSYPTAAVCHTFPLPSDVTKSSVATGLLDSAVCKHVEMTWIKLMAVIRSIRKPEAKEEIMVRTMVLISGSGTLALYLSTMPRPTTAFRRDHQPNTAKPFWVKRQQGGLNDRWTHQTNSSIRSSNSDSIEQSHLKDRSTFLSDTTVPSLKPRALLVECVAWRRRSSFIIIHGITPEAVLGRPLLIRPKALAESGTGASEWGGEGEQLFPLNFLALRLLLPVPQLGFAACQRLQDPHEDGYQRLHHTFTMVLNNCLELGIQFSCLFTHDIGVQLHLPCPTKHSLTILH
ncbi:hypothetical protein EYF80_016353 [Liparis tanakae]|uniref:Uncharacterized protein n=1 Tax=Liparis tanakae TaxID=230148 RepID=A0A4Z2I5R6_9TELE|nr:hypothetical protein EYF80_016353 [Liparis tanakae]